MTPTKTKPRVTKSAMKRCYFFGNGAAEGRAEMKTLLGGKGANLAEMTNLRLPVPPGFTITAETCIAFYEQGKQWPTGLEDEVRQALQHLEQVTGKRFGDAQNPLLVSVRSGAAFSMPGMMDTILNLGLNDATVEGLARKTRNPRFAYDSYRRFLQMFGDVVLGIKHKQFEDLLHAAKYRIHAQHDTELMVDDLKVLVTDYHQLMREETERPFAQEPWEQLRLAIDAVFNSWNNKRAVTYRDLHRLPHTLGTAVNIQAMVFGNMGERSATGVAFTRNPSTGERAFYGEYLINAQGEDVVAGIRTPNPIDQLQHQMPQMYQQLLSIAGRLEQHYRDMQDLEFTVEEDTLYFLQTRAGKRTAQAAVNIAVDMVAEGLIDQAEAVLRVQPEQLNQLLHPMIDPTAHVEALAKGLPASPGAAVGRVVFTTHQAITMAEDGQQVILVRDETSPEDIGGMAVAQGILTARGGMTSHAAVVARGMGKCCVAGCGALMIREEEHQFLIGETVVHEGDVITLNGSTGEVILGELRLVEPTLTPQFRQLLVWADQVRRLGVRANADTPFDAKVARDFGAEGIGLCRTEHMFFGADRLPVVREMILATDAATRHKALAKLLPMQREDFIGIFKVMAGLPVTIRLLDPPLHEFLPTIPEDIDKTAKQLGRPVQEVQAMVASLKEFNPMLGHRGCRLGITFPEIYEMQVRAIFEAACQVTKEGQTIVPEVMVPLVGYVSELKVIRERTIRVAEETMAASHVKLTYLIGTMIELPRAAVVADEIARAADFFSFGTNDLTQMTFGFSRDDIGKFLPTYLKEGLLPADPFATLDVDGVGQLIRMGVQKGRATSSKLKIGICGEHGGDPASVEFCHRVGLDYVSCSPFRVPIARLAAAQAALKGKKEK